MRRNSTDEEIRDLERRAAFGDAVAAERLARMRERIEGPIKAALRRAEAAARQDRVQTADRSVRMGFGPVVADTPLTYIENRVRAAFLLELGVSRLPRGTANLILETAKRIFDEHEPERQARAEAARARAEEEVRARITDLRAVGFRVLGRTDLAELLSTAEGTGSRRNLSVDDLIDAVRRARASGIAHVEAEHDVASSYKYPVSYTAASAYRDGEDVVVSITRTQTWGRRPDTRTVAIVGADLFAERANPDEALRDLERRYLAETSIPERTLIWAKAVSLSARLDHYPACAHCLVFLEWKDCLCRVCHPHFPIEDEA
jgi:hypothetical protein